MTESKQLELKFDPNTIDDLGAKLYSTLPPIISELVANGYDAGADEIYIDCNDLDPKNKTIIIRDNGNGMSFDQINDNYLVVGRKKREYKETNDPIFNRPVMGKKGIGKLSFFGITDNAEITTIQNGLKVTFAMNREEIKKSSKYYPEFTSEKSGEKNGTTIKLQSIKRESNFNFASLKNAIANYFLFDKDFRVFIKYNNNSYEEITNDTRYKQWDIQFRWKFPNKECEFPEGIQGELFTTKKPISKNLRGIALLSRKKLVNLPALFPIDTSSYFHEYLAGYLEVDFIDDLPIDVISTDRKTLNWGDPALDAFEKWLKDMIKTLEKDWREKWRAEKEKLVNADPEIKAKKSTIRTKEEEKKLDASIVTLSSSNLDSDTTIKIVNELSVEYPEFHNKNLEKELEELTLEEYKQERYFDAVVKGAKRYITKIRSKISKETGDEKSVIDEAFKEVGPALSITRNYESYKNASTDAVITEQTKTSITKGNFLLAQAMMLAFRNPLSHQEHEDLKASGLYTAKDCLDALSLLSHLFRRLDNAELIERNMPLPPQCPPSLPTASNS